MSAHTPWFNGPLLGFDTETTGVSPLHSRIVTASIIVTGEEPVTHNWLINPGVDIPTAAQEVHGISTAMAKAKGSDPLFALAEIRDVLVGGMKAGHPIVAFNASFDLTIMETELARYGLDTMTDLLGREPFPIIDPLVLDRMVDPYRRGPRRLETLIGLYRIDASGFHNAENDVAATLKLLQAMIADHAILRASSLRKLHELQKTTHEHWAESFNRYLTERGRRADVDEHWPVLPPTERSEGDVRSLPVQGAAPLDNPQPPPF